MQLVSEGGLVAHILIGDAVGDAFGLGIEFASSSWIRQHVAFPPSSWPSCPTAPNGKAGPDGKPVTERGMYSDDCEMTVGTMKALMKCGAEYAKLQESDLLQAWEEEWRLGGRCRVGHGSIRFVWSGEQTLDQIKELQRTKTIPGNAPPMRSLPLLFLSTNDRQNLCRTNADTTHPHPQTRAASMVIAAGARWLVISRGEQAAVLSTALAELQTSQLRDEATERHLKCLESLPDWHEYGERFENLPKEVHELLCGPQPDPDWCGLGSDSMRTAALVLYILKWYRDPLDALVAAVDVGGDVDSTAALVLGIIGGSTGLRLGQVGGIPWFLIFQLEGVEYLVAQAKQFESWLHQNALLPTRENTAAP